MNAIAYARYSTDNQTENSIEYQYDKINTYAKMHEIDVIAYFADRALSGTNTDRNGLQDLLAACESRIYGGKAFDAVIIYDQSRLSRNMMDWFALRDRLDKNSVKLISCSQALNSDHLDPSGFISEGAQAIFNQFHVLETRKKPLTV